MTLAEVALPISLNDARQLALVFSTSLAARLATLHEKHGTQNCIPMPLTLTDGRLALCGDLLTEVMPGGLLHAMWAAADQAVLLPSVEVIPWADAVALLPPEPLQA